MDTGIGQNCQAGTGVRSLALAFITLGALGLSGCKPTELDPRSDTPLVRVASARSATGRRVHALSEKRLDPLHQGAGLAGSGTGPQLVGAVAMVGSDLLCLILLEREIFLWGFGDNFRKQEDVQDLLPNQRNWQTDGRCDF